MAKIGQEEKHLSYRAYLLRCWQEGASTSGQESGWRFVMEEIRPDEQHRQGFGSLEALLAFLRTELAGDRAVVPPELSPDLE